MSLSILLGLVFTWLVAPACLFLATVRATGEPGEERWVLLGFCWSFAPAVISRMVTWAMYLAPGAPDLLYSGAVVASFGLLGLYGAPKAGLLRTMSREGACWLRRWNRALLGAAAVAGVLVVMVLPGLFGPMLTRSYGIAVAGWNPAQFGWSAIMPRFAAATLGLFAVGACFSAGYAGRGAGSSAWQIRESAAVALIAGALGAVLVLAFCLIVARPLFENDAVQYFKVANLLYQEHSLAHYPVMPAAPDGTYASSAHPLGHYGLLIWGLLIAGGSIPGPGKLLVFGTCLSSLVGIAIALRRHGPVAAASAMLLLVTTPSYFAQLVACGIDPPRLAFLLLAILAVAWSLQRDSWPAWGCAGIAAGLALNSHSESLIAVPVAIAAIGLLARGMRWQRRITAMLVIGTIAVAVGGERFILNQIAFGWPVNNDLEMWRLVPSLEYRAWRSSVVPRHDWLGRLVEGPLLGFSSWYFFVFTWWLATLAGVLERRTVAGDAMLRAVAASGIGTFALVAIYLGLPGTGELLIGNYRYLLCIQPVAVVLAGLLVGKMLGANPRLS